MKIHGLVACRNRRDLTLKSVGQLFDQFDYNNIDFSLTLVDDGSSDGTVEAIREQFPRRDIVYVRGEGDLYWAGGMRYGWSKSAKYKDFDLLMVFNDDISLHTGALKKIVSEIEALRIDNELFLLACAFENEKGKISYSGMVQTSKFFPLKFSRIEPVGKLIRIDTFNCNLVFIEKHVIDRVGFFEEYFVHTGADNEYGMRASRACIPIYLSGSVAGICERNDVSGTSYEKGIGPVNRFRRRYSLKETPHKQTYLFYKKMGGRYWLFHLAFSYLKTVIR
jgi:GT2 family glycosyltransferase